MVARARARDRAQRRDRVRLDDEDETLACATAPQKSEAFNRIYWRLRGCRTRPISTLRVDALAARYGIDMPALREELCMSWDEVRALAADPLATIGAHTVNHVMLAKASDAVAHAELKRGRETVEAQLGRDVRISPIRMADATSSGRANSGSPPSSATAPP